MISKSFFESLEAITIERELKIEDVLKKVEIAMGVACRKVDPPYTGEIKLEYDFEKKRIKFFEHQYVVEAIDLINGPARGQILLEDALEIKPKSKVGTEIKTEINPNTFKRTAASIFKQNLLSGLKELERETAYQYFSDKVGEIVTGEVIRIDKGFVTFIVGKHCEANMPEKEALPNEEFKVGDYRKLYITKVEKGTKGPKIYISRSCKEIVKALFELEIPEIKNGQIEIMGLARDPGSRTKIGVYAVTGDIDPKGACVGAGGLRIKSINESLNGEKIDIFTWRNNSVDLIAEALLPAQVLSVIPNEKTRQAVVIVNDDQFSLAIGKNGQNAKLAAFAISWKIDIKKLSDALSEGLEFTYNVSSTGVRKRA